MGITEWSFYFKKSGFFQFVLTSNRKFNQNDCSVTEDYLLVVWKGVPLCVELFVFHYKEFITVYIYIYIYIYIRIVSIYIYIYIYGYMTIYVCVCVCVCVYGHVTCPGSTNRIDWKNIGYRTWNTQGVSVSRYLSSRFWFETSWAMLLATVIVVWMWP